MKKIIFALLILISIVSDAQMYYQPLLVDSSYKLTGMIGVDGQFGYAKDSKSYFIYDSVVNKWLPSSRTTVKKSTVTINAKNTGSTAIYTLENLPGNLNYYPIMLIPRAVNISGVTTPPTVSIGTNSSSYNNIASGSLLSSLLATLSVGNGVPANASYSPALPSGSVIYVNVTTGAIATNYSIKYDIVVYADQ